MSCETKFREYNDTLAAETNLAAGSVDAAPRCIKCDRPLLRDGRCVMGHAQTAGQPADPAPLADALRCLLESGIAGAEQYQDLYYYRWSLQHAVTKAQQSLQQLGEAETVDLDTIQNLLQAVKELRDAGRTSDLRDLLQDPRVQAATSLVAEQRLAAAAEMAGSSDLSERLQALQEFAEIEVWANEWENPAAAGRAARGRQQILPLADLRRAPAVLAQQFNAAVGNTFVTNETTNDLESLWGGNGIRVSTLPEEELDFYPDEVRQVVRQELGIEIESDISGGAPGSVAISTDQLIKFLWQRVQEMQDAAAELETGQADMEQAAGQLSPVQVAQQHALPLYQEATQMQEQLQSSLRDMGAPGEAILERIFQVKARALQSVRDVPLPQLPQALASLRFSPRVMGLLKYQAVRDAVFDPHNDVDLLTHLPRLAPRAVAALRACELVEGIYAEDQGGPQDRSYVVGPQSEEEVATLIQAGELLRRVSEWELAARAGEPQRKDRWYGAVATIVDALSEHAPDDKEPFQANPEGGYINDSRLKQTRYIYQEIWKTGYYTDRFSVAAVRQWAHAAGMPSGRYADREQIVEWLRDPNPTNRRQQEVRTRCSLAGKNTATIRATDRTGTDRLYKRGERVRFRGPAGQDLEGEITSCVLQPSDETREEDMGYYRVQQVAVELYPAAEVELDDGSTQTVHIAEVELMRKKKKKK